ncbi:MAG TPA: hypothetical protein PKE06_22780, partial [Flavilitoribacter sp.]|nr:hypothetical protein [Flavilitoribacter sp.]
WFLVGAGCLGVGYALVWMNPGPEKLQKPLPQASIEQIEKAGKAEMGSKEGWSAKTDRFEAAAVTAPKNAHAQSVRSTTAGVDSGTTQAAVRDNSTAINSEEGPGQAAATPGNDVIAGADEIQTDPGAVERLNPFASLTAEITPLEMATAAYSPEIKPVRTPNHHFGLEAGALLTTGAGLAGFTLAAAWQKTLRSGNWRLYAGLGVRKQVIPLSLARNGQNKLAFAQADSNGSVSPGNVYTNFDTFTLDQAESVSASQYVLGIVAQTNAGINATYLDGYFTAGRTISSRLTAESGLRLGYLLHSAWKALPNNNEALQLANSRILAAGSGNGLVSGQVLSNLDIALLGGVRYALSSHIDLGLQYQYGVTDLLLLDNVRLPNRSLKLFMGYRF